METDDKSSCKITRLKHSKILFVVKSSEIHRIHIPIKNSADD